MPEPIGEMVGRVMSSLRAAEQRRKEMSEEKKSLRVYTIVKSTKENGKDYWHEIGRAFVNKDGSLNVRLNALPLNGTLHIRDENQTA